MRISKPIAFSTLASGRATVVILGVTAFLLAGLGGATATAARGAGSDHAAGFGSDAAGHGPRDKDSRGGVVAATAGQRAAAARTGARVRWNRLGTPHSLGPVAGGLASGLAADPERAARQYLADSVELFGLDADAVAELETLLVRPIGAGAVVQLRQRFGQLEAGHDGLVSILVGNGTVVHVSSSLSKDTRAPVEATLSAADAIAAATRDAGLTAHQVSHSDSRLVAVPTPAQGPRAAYEVTLVSTQGAVPTAFTTYVDARTGDVLVREDLVDFDADNPRWAVFPATPVPPAAPGTREIWCATAATGCQRALRDQVSGQAYDLDMATGLPTFTSRGNSANTGIAFDWDASIPPVAATPSPTRDYLYPFDDQWHQERCNPAVFASPGRNDADASIANLFVMHNRMHDWAFHLGFTEATWNLQAVNLGPDGLGGDAQQGRAQAGAVGGRRNNASQITPPDGIPPRTDMLLWQPIAGIAYPPCVDGDYDMTVIGHEYSHAISNRMIAGPNGPITGFQGGAMGESWSDMLAAEYLFEHGFRAPGDTPFVTGGYVTGNHTNGLRNYDMSRSPLNYSDVGYDRIGPQVHADGELWSATNMRIRNAFLARYGAGTPTQQLACAQGEIDVSECPGNRRWAQLTFDSFLLQASSRFSMLDMRDNMLAADQVRFGGANQDIMWNAFAESGMGVGATSSTPNDIDPIPGFASPHAENATVSLRPTGESRGANLRLYLGDYEARAMPIADTDPATALPETFQVVPNVRFRFIAVGSGWGHHKFTEQFRAGRAQSLNLNLPRNLASTASGAVAAGDGVNLDKLVDDTEATNWASLDGVEGKQVMIDLAGDKPSEVRRVNVSALLRPPIDGDADPEAQNAFSALRSFQILTCNSTDADCTQDGSYQLVFASAADAFPGGAFRPVSPQTNLRTFDVQPSEATHVRIRVVDSQCTGGPLYAGEQDDDPQAATDCATASPAATQVRIAEVQVFKR